MMKNQKNTIPGFSQLLIFMLIQGLCILPAQAASNNASIPEHLSPRINISHSSFSQLIKKAHSDALDAAGNISINQETLNLLDITYQFKQREILEQQISDSFKVNYPEQKLLLQRLRVFFNIAKTHYENKKFESGEFVYNHVLEVAAIAAENEADFREILAALFHRMPTRKLKEVQESIVGRLGKKEAAKFFEEELEDINSLIEKVKEVSKLRHKTATRGGHLRENFMGQIINILEGDYRALRLILCDKQASIEHASEIEIDELAEEIKKIYGPFAGRFGMSAIKNELENILFEKHNPKGYAMIMRKVRNTYGMDYEYLEASLQPTREIVQALADKNAIDSRVTARVKKPYRIYVKDQNPGPKDIVLEDALYAVDTMGVKVICETKECYNGMISQIRNAFNKEELGKWEEAKFKGAKYFKKFVDKDDRPLDITYFQGKEKNGSGKLEIQILTKKADDLREIIYGHWSYEIGRLTGYKQKFDNAEAYKFNRLYEKYEAALEDPDLESVNLYEVVDEYFKSVYEYHKQWVYVSEKSTKLIGGVFLDVVSPKRFRKGANGAVFATRRKDKNKFNKNYSGIRAYEWRGDKLKAKDERSQPNDMNPINDGDILRVTTSNNALLEKLDLYSSIKNFPRTAILFTQSVSSEYKRQGYENIAKSDIIEAFAKVGIIWDKSKKQEKEGFKSLLKNRYMENFLTKMAKAYGLETYQELLIGLATGVIQSNNEDGKDGQIIQAKAVVDWAYERGLSLLREKILFDDLEIKSKITGLYQHKTLEKLIIEVGIGRLKAEGISKKLRALDTVKMSYESATGRFSYIIKVLGLERIRDTDIKAAKKEIETILKDNGMKLSANFQKTIRGIKLSNKIKLKFSIPATRTQGEKIGAALESVGKVQAKPDEKTFPDKMRSRIVDPIRKTNLIEAAI